MTIGNPTSVAALVNLSIYNVTVIYKKVKKIFNLLKEGEKSFFVLNQMLEFNFKPKLTFSHYTHKKNCQIIMERNNTYYW